MPTATDVREQVVELAREFAREKIEPFAAEWDRTSHFPRDVIDELGKLGFLGLCTPEEYDGMGLDTVTYLMVLEEISAADAALAVSIGIHNAIPTTMLVRHGTPEQRERWLKPMARGELLAGLDSGRLGIGAQGVGIARKALELSIKYCAERRQFGKAIEDFQAVQFKLADMATRIEAARALAQRAAARKDAGEDITLYASMAKLFASETAMWVTTQAIQLFGGYGYMRDFPVEKLFRDAKVTEIYEGTSEIQRIVIARALTRHS